MNTNDLPLAQKLAALMEAGRAAHPNVRHSRGTWGDGKTEGCAMTFAALGAGIQGDFAEPLMQKLAEHLGVDMDELGPVAKRVIRLNDRCGKRVSLDEIIAAVREDRLPEAPVAVTYSNFGDFAALDAQIWEAFKAHQHQLIADVVKMAALPNYYIVWVDAPTLKITVGTVSDKQPKPDKSVRASAKTGATWPKPKHAYA